MHDATSSYAQGSIERASYGWICAVVEAALGSLVYRRPHSRSWLVTLRGHVYSLSTSQQSHTSITTTESNKLTLLPSLLKTQAPASATGATQRKYDSTR